MAADLGLDKVLVYRFDSAKGSLAPNDPPFTSVSPGAGPRHLAFSSNGKFVYVVDELQASISEFSYDASAGALHLLETISTLPKDFTGEKSAAEIAVSPSGKFLYVSNRGHNSIAVFSINGQTGRLTLVEHVPTEGKTPRNFAIDPTGSSLFAANQDSDNIVIFKVDSMTGRLTPSGQVLQAESPTFVTFVPVD